MTGYIRCNIIDHRCALSFCNSIQTSTAEAGKLSFFSFPEDPVRCAVWVKNCNSKYLPTADFNTLNKKYKLCSLHFEDRMLNFQKNRLLSIATPTLFKNRVPVVISVPSQNVNETIIIDDDVPPGIPINALTSRTKYAPVTSSVTSQNVYETITIDDDVPPGFLINALTPRTKYAPVTSSVTSQNVYETIAIDDDIPPGIPIDSLAPRSKYDSCINRNLFDVPTSTGLVKNSVSLQTPNYLSAKSPRKLKLKKQLAEEINSKKHLEKTIIELRKQIEKTNSEDNCLKLCEMYLPSTMFLLVKNYFINKNKAPNGQRHISEIAQFAHTIHHLGPKVYHFLQKHFTLPHIRTLKKINTQNVDTNIQDLVQNDHKYSKI